MSKVNPKIMIMAGGTGGHVFPALAVAKELMDRQCEVQWMGTSRGIEARIVPENKITLNLLKITGIRGKGALALVVAPFKVLTAIVEAVGILRSFKPNVVLGMGGYVSGPGGIAAWILRIPLVVHEQNARPGTTNKWLAKFSKKTLSAFPEVLPGAIHIGNPIRREIINVASPAERLSKRSGSLRILVMGGSLGAKAINDLLPQVIAETPKSAHIEVQHQTGAAHYEATLALYRERGVVADVKPFIDDMAQALSWADLVVCRSGALTVSELSAVGVASILVPFPFAIDDHQTANAEWLVNSGAAFLQVQHQLTVQKLKIMIMEFIENKALVLDMAIAARNNSKPKAAIDCADICLELTHV